MIDDKTPGLGLPLPHPDNWLEEDVLRLRRLADELDVALVDFFKALALKADADALLDLVGKNDPRLSDDRKPKTHTHTRAQISDATAIGRNVLGAASQEAARAVIGASNFSGKYEDLVDKPGPPDLSEKLDRSGGMTKGVTASYLNKGTVSSGTVVFDYADAECQRVQAAGNLAVEVIWPQSGFVEMLIEVHDFGAYTIKWPAAWRWVKADGTKTTTVSNNGIAWQMVGVDFVLVWTRNGGATVYAKVMR